MGIIMWIKKARVALGLWCCAMGLVGCSTFLSPAPDGELGLAPSPTWQTLRHGAITLEIPPGYVAGIPNEQLAELQASLENAGFGDRTDWLAQNAEEIAIIAFAPQGDTLNGINVVQEDREPDQDLKAYLQQQGDRLTAAGLTISRQLIEPETNQGILHLERGNFQEYIYVYPDAETFWVVTYSGAKEHLDLDLIDQSRRTVQLLQTEEQS